MNASEGIGEIRNMREENSTHPPVVAISRTLSHDGEAELSRERDGRVRQ